MTLNARSTRNWHAPHNNRNMRYSRHIPIFMLCLLAVAALMPDTASAVQLFPGENPSGDFREYVIAFYNFSISAGILIATVLIMIGGMIWVTSAGNSSRVELAKSYIIDSIIGVILLIGAVVILRLVNPALVDLPTFAPSALGGPLGACVYNDPQGNYQRCQTTSQLYCSGGDFEGILKGTWTQGKACKDVCPLKEPANNARPQECESPASGDLSNDLLLNSQSCLTSGPSRPSFCPPPQSGGLEQFFCAGKTKTYDVVATDPEEAGLDCISFCKPCKTSITTSGPNGRTWTCTCTPQ